MKTYYRIAVLVFIGCFSKMAWANRAGEIILMKGDVFILDSKANIVGDPQGRRGRQTKVGTEFLEGETISTKVGARVKLKFDEGGNEVVLGSDTTLLIERAGGGGARKGTSLNLSKGEVRSDVKIKYSGQGADVYEVKSKNAVAGVRGTIFTAILDKSANFTVATERGKVFVQTYVKGASVSVNVEAGKFTIANTEGASQPKPTSSNPELAKKLDTLGGSSEKSSSKDGDTKGDAKGNSKSDSGDKADSGDKKDDSAKQSDGEKSDKSAKNGNGDSSEKGDKKDGQAKGSENGDKKDSQAKGSESGEKRETADAPNGDKKSDGGNNGGKSADNRRDGDASGGKVAANGDTPAPQSNEPPPPLNRMQVDNGPTGGGNRMPASEMKPIIIGTGGGMMPGGDIYHKPDLVPGVPGGPPTRLPFTEPPKEVFEGIKAGFEKGHVTIKIQ